MYTISDEPSQSTQPSAPKLCTLTLGTRPSSAASHSPPHPTLTPTHHWHRRGRASCSAWTGRTRRAHTSTRRRRCTRRAATSPQRTSPCGRYEAQRQVEARVGSCCCGACELSSPRETVCCLLFCSMRGEREQPQSAERRGLKGFEHPRRVERPTMANTNPMFAQTGLGFRSRETSKRNTHTPPCVDTLLRPACGLLDVREPR